MVRVFLVGQVAKAKVEGSKILPFSQTGTAVVAGGGRVRGEERCLVWAFAWTCRIGGEEVGIRGTGGGGAYSFVACLCHLTIDHASFSRRSTTGDREGGIF